MGFLGAILLIILVVVGVWIMATRRPPTDAYFDQPEDLKRADDNQPPPMDGTAGMWPN